MEKSWENFWTTGKVEDYLNYRNCDAVREVNMQEDASRQQRMKMVREDNVVKDTKREGLR